MNHLTKLKNLLHDFIAGKISDRAFHKQILYTCRNPNLVLPKDLSREINGLYALCSMYKPGLEVGEEDDLDEAELKLCAATILRKLDNSE